MTLASIHSLQCCYFAIQLSVSLTVLPLVGHGVGLFVVGEYVGSLVGVIVTGLVGNLVGAMFGAMVGYLVTGAGSAMRVITTELGTNKQRRVHLLLQRD